jgi:hypothetical protein
MRQSVPLGGDGGRGEPRGILQPMRLLPFSLVVLASTFSLLASPDAVAAPPRPVPASKNVAAPAKPAKPMPSDDKAALAEVVAHVKSAGRQKAFSDFTARKPPFFDNDRFRYVVCVDSKLVVVAHAGFPTYVGSAEFFRDAGGKLVPPIIWAAATKGDGTVRYSIRSDETNNKAENRIGVFQRIKDDVCGIVARAP